MAPSGNRKPPDRPPARPAPRVIALDRAAISPVALLGKRREARFPGRYEQPAFQGKGRACRLSYDDGVPISVKKWRNEEAARRETFRTEHEALKRARQLLDHGDHHAVVVCDSSGNTLGGIRLQLKLGFFGE